MQKCIIISIRPEWVEKILNGEKTIEIRKSMPKCDYPIDVYIYCTKGKINLYSEYIENWQYFDGPVAEPFMDQKQLRLTKEKYTEGVKKYPLIKVYRKKLNGKIVAKFTLNETRKYQTGDVYREHAVFSEEWYEGRLGSCNGRGNLEFEQIEKLLEKSCLTENEIHEYAGTGDWGELDYGYFVTWHIDNLVIFDKPMELSDFYRNNFDEDKSKPCNCGKSCKYEDYDLQENQRICGIDYDGQDCPYLKVSKAPQSWCYAWR